MTVREIVNKIENGSAHVILWNYDSAVVYLSTIWYNLIDENLLDKEVKSICVRDYELRLGVVD